MRVFGDRMINNKDRDVLNELLQTECDSKEINVKREHLFNAERLIYGDYLNGIDGENRPYL